MTPDQLRIARATLKLTVRDVERLTGVNKDSISRYEAAKEILEGALRKLGAVFREEVLISLDEGSSAGGGVRLPSSRPGAGSSK